MQQQQICRREQQQNLAVAEPISNSSRTMQQEQQNQSATRDPGYQATASADRSAREPLASPIPNRWRRNFLLFPKKTRIASHFSKQLEIL